MCQAHFRCPEVPWCFAALQPIVLWLVLLRTTTHYYVLLLRTTTYYYVLLRTTTYYYVLLRTTRFALAASGHFQTILLKELYCNLIGNVPWQPQGNSKPFSLRNGINFDRKWSLAASAGALVLERRLPARNLDQRFFNFLNLFNSKSESFYWFGIGFKANI